VVGRQNANIAYTLHQVCCHGNHFLAFDGLYLRLCDS